MRTIAFSNQKGGTGKTTSATSLGACLAELGYKVLLVDLDPQSSMTQSLGIDAAGQSMAEVLGGSTPGDLALADIIQEVAVGMDLAPSDVKLAGCELGLVQRLGREAVLKYALEGIAENYHVALIDCPPSLGLLTVNGLNASDGLICPVQPSATDLRGMVLFLETLDMIKKALNPTLELLGILITRFDARTAAHANIVKQVQSLNWPVFDQVIPQSIQVQRAAGFKKLLTVYDPGGKPLAAYRELANEVNKWLKNQI